MPDAPRATTIPVFWLAVYEHEKRNQQQEMAIIPSAIANEDSKSLLWRNVVCHGRQSNHGFIADELICISRL